LDTAVHQAPAVIDRYAPISLGVSYLYPQLKHNNFKPKHLLVQKLMRGDSHGYYH
jgi:hypothetical protein